MFGHMGGLGWGWILGGLLMLLFWAGVLALAFLAIRAIIRSGEQKGERGAYPVSGDSPLDILKKRYARGEISREEYQEMRRELES